MTQSQLMAERSTGIGGSDDDHIDYDEFTDDEELLCPGCGERTIDGGWCLECLGQEVFDWDKSQDEWPR